MSEMDKKNELYQKRVPIITRSVKGKFRRIKTSILFLAYLVFFLLPWIPWDRGIPEIANQAVFFDINGRQFYIFNLPINIKNIMWLAGVLAIFAFSLFFITAILGRVFCGYFCFQTLWTDVFIMIETWVQGSRNARKKLHEEPWNSKKISKVGLTWFLWFIFAFWSGFTFTAYWTYAPQLFKDFFVGNAAFAAYATTGFLTLTTFLMAGFAREQVCTYMCPYARFQGVMFDKDTLVVAYDYHRGEREKGRKKASRELRDYETRKASGYGDCVDCDLCVQVCPAGIDIRNGVDYKCITCGLCIDACHNVMQNLGYPTGLIRYASEENLEGKKTRYFRPRNVGYGIMLLIVTTILAWSVITRQTMSFSIEPERALPVKLSNGAIQNRYDITYTNLELEPQIVNIALKDSENYQLKMKHNNSEIQSGYPRSFKIYVRQKPHAQTKERSIIFVITIRSAKTNEVLEVKEASSIFKR